MSLKGSEVIGSCLADGFQMSIKRDQHLFIVWLSFVTRIMPGQSWATTSAGCQRENSHPFFLESIHTIPLRSKIKSLPYAPSDQLRRYAQEHRGITTID